MTGLRLRAGAVLLLGASVLPLAACSSSEKQLTAERLAVELRERGAQDVLSRYFPCDAYEGSGYEQVAQGSGVWVQLATQLLEHSDACYTTGLQDALGSAMQAAPENVLPYVGRNAQLAPERICLPFISAEIPTAEQLKPLSLARGKIEPVREPRLQAQRDACLAEIQRVERMILGHRP